RPGHRGDRPATSLRRRRSPPRPYRPSPPRARSGSQTRLARPRRDRRRRIASPSRASGLRRSVPRRARRLTAAAVTPRVTQTMPRPSWPAGPREEGALGRCRIAAALIVAVVAVSAGCSGHGVGKAAPPPAEAKPSVPVAPTDWDSLNRAAAQRGTIPVVVALDTSFVPEGYLSAKDQAKQ